MGTHPVIYIRTDGNTQIATGHLVRCLSIARALKGNAHVSFLVSDTESFLLLQNFFDMPEEFPVHILENAGYNKPEAELSSLIPFGAPAACPENDASRPVLFIDSYFVTERYLTSLKPYFKLAYIDDLRKFDYPVELVVNYDLLTPKTRQAYELFYSRAGQKLLGGSYAPLRTQFQCRQPKAGDFDLSLKSVPDSGTCHILLTTGGSDPYHTCLRLTRYLLNYYSYGYHYHIVAGRLNTDKEALTSLSENSPVTIHENVSDMAGLMASCDLAVSAAGTTLYELCATGVPSASLIIADNQEASAKAFDETGMIPLLGDVRTGMEDVEKKATQWVASMNPFARCGTVQRLTRYAEICRNMNQQIDGNGAIRIANALLSLSASE